MKIKATIIILFFFLKTIHGQNIVVSSYFIGSDQRDSWIELLVTTDNTDIRNYTIGDYGINGGGHLNTYRSITFKSIALWKNLRRGTIIVLYCRETNSMNMPYGLDTSAADGYLYVNAQATFLFDNTPATNDQKLNFNEEGDKVHIKNGTTDVHSLGHGTNHSNWTLVNSPKLVNNQEGEEDHQIQVSPGATIGDYTNTIEDTIKTNMTDNNFTEGLPNVRSGWLIANQNFWRTMREPSWTNPTLTITCNTLRTVDTLVWNLMTDPYPADQYQGYLVLKSLTGVFSEAPVDGYTYNVGDPLGTAEVIAVINSSQVRTLTHAHVGGCNLTYYRVYPFRFTTDEPNGNGYHLARGRAYNQSSFAAGNSPVVNPVPILYHY